MPPLLTIPASTLNVRLDVASLTMQSTGLEQEDYFDFLFKIILIGDTDVGKTSVIQRFKTGNFSERQQSTIGVDFIVRTLNIQGRKVKVSLNDLITIIIRLFL